MRMRRLTWAMSLSLGLMAVAAAAQPPQPRYGGTIVVATPSDPSTLNLGLSISAPVYIAAGPVFDSLLRYGPRMSFQPWLEAHSRTMPSS